MASTSSSSSSSCKYEVFLSFRGEDTREGFTSHLHAGLCRKKIKTFIDEELRRGDEISPALLDAIVGSKISVIIFSKAYASSKWCLNELVKILECKKINGQIIIPVFYHVHPSDLRKQTGSFGVAFVKHENDFKEMPGMVQKWRVALTEASYLSGYESTKIRPEARLVEVIVQDILERLEKMTVSTEFSEGLIGLDSQVDHIKSLLGIGLLDCRIIGIWGMGGIGKTTLVEALFKQIFGIFEGTYFIGNVREKLQKGYVFEDLQKQVLSKLLDEDLEMGSLNIRQYTKERLRRMKVFVVLDDVNEVKQLEYIVGKLGGFGPGSRIVVTTRDKHVLDEYGVNNIYELTGLDYHQAVELFCNYAFTQNHPPQDLKVLFSRVVNYAKGNPLALKVLGSFFHQKDKQEWENALENLKQITNYRIYDVLKISYDELHLNEQNLFLDIACFFKGDDRDHVAMILSDDHSSVHYGLNVLVKKSLITILYGRLVMHDLLQELGHEIVRLKSIKEPGRRSRLWNAKDVYHVLKKNKGTSSIEGLFLDMSEIRDLYLNSEVFAKMPNLRLLKLYMPDHYDNPNLSSKVHLPQGLDYLPDELRYLHWHGYPLKTLPSNFSPESLVELNLPHSKLEQLWDEEKEAFKLKSIDLHHSQCLTQIPSQTTIPILEEINLSYCTKLLSVSPSIEGFNNLSKLSLSGCESLRCFPKEVCFKSTITIDFSNCVNLKEFPRISGKVIVLLLRNTAIEEIPAYIEGLTNLQWLDLTSCARLKSVSTSICKLKSLYLLHLGNCSSLDNFPEIMEKMESLEYIDLRSTAIKELPSSIERVEELRQLWLNNCSKLDKLPENLGNLKSLNSLNADRSTLSQLPSSFAKLNKFESLYLRGCRGCVLPPLSSLASLKWLFLTDCGLMEIPEDIDCLSSLLQLDLGGNNFESLPATIKQLLKLVSLNLSNCNMLFSIPELPVSLWDLNAGDCRRLQSLPELPSCPEELNASLLQALYIRYKAYSWDRPMDTWGMFATFINCQKLNEKANKVLADSQLSIQHNIILLLRFLYEEKEKYVGPTINMCLPGSGIPEWFSNQRSGSSITIRLPQDGCHKKFIGLALSVVIEFEEDSDARGKPLRVTCRVPETYSFYSFNRYHDTGLFNHGHVFLGFNLCWNPWLRLPDGDHHTAVSFQFSASYVSSDNTYKDQKVKCCGVCPVYAHPNETKPNTFTLKFEEECTEIENLDSDFTDMAGMSGTDDINLFPREFA